MKILVVCGKIKILKSKFSKIYEIIRNINFFDKTIDILTPILMVLM